MNQTICVTSAGAAPGKPCIFPFEFNGAIHYKCTWDQSQLTDNKPWCSTLVDSTGHHVGGQSKWGNCGSGCPIAPRAGEKEEAPVADSIPSDVEAGTTATTTATVTKDGCPQEGQYGPNCTCFEDNAAYFGNNHRVGLENPQPSRLACQKSCQNHPSCSFWTWGKGTPTGPCYLKTQRENVGYDLTSYVSGSKNCQLPEAGLEGSSGRERCTSEQFECGEAGKCIPKRWVCDYHWDCDGGEDEYDCQKTIITQK
eukprot:TCALIF_08423-PA protein Name:"Protein of unknown function" AED:0.91 eAED:0.91 QI:0/0/0/0.2/1/1/5/0/253